MIKLEDYTDKELQAELKKRVTITAIRNILKEIRSRKSGVKHDKI